jgi:hypothetical protein
MNSLPTPISELIDFMSSPLANDLLPPIHPSGPRRPRHQVNISTHLSDWEADSRRLLFPGVFEDVRSPLFGAVSEGRFSVGRT